MGQQLIVQKSFYTLFKVMTYPDKNQDKNYIQKTLNYFMRCCQI